MVDWCVISSSTTHVFIVPCIILESFGFTGMINSHQQCRIFFSAAIVAALDMGWKHNSSLRTQSQRYGSFSFGIFWCWWWWRGFGNTSSCSENWGDTQTSTTDSHCRKIIRLTLQLFQLTPFLSERENTWCKDKSLPEFYEKPDVVHANTEAFVKPPPTAFSTSSDSMLTSRENRPILPLSDLNKVRLLAYDACHGQLYVAAFFVILSGPLVCQFT